ncbi:MAG: H-NS histone family protein [Gemmatimonadota bacterium]|jgi:DNA-binding protein H-NS|nr:H-NS histone family protein [Gemmatimonadota bacterium]
MARSAVPDVIREKIHELQSKLERIETQQRETRAAALGFISEALERLGLTLQDLAAGVGARRGRKGKVGRPSIRRKTKGAKKAAKKAAKKVGKRGRPAKATKKGASAKAKKAGTRGAAKGGKVPAKYRGPNGEVWSGRGKQPRWLAALVAEGRSPAEFLI